MPKLFTAISALLLFCLSPSFANTKNKNVTIASATNLYEFVYNKKTQKVEVKEKLTTNYYCNDFRVTVPISETYNDQVSIDNVDVKPSYVKPEYSYYKDKDIFFSDERLCFFPLPLERKGATGTVTFEETVKDPKYFTGIFLADSYDIAHKEVIITVPRWMKVEFKEMNFAGLDITKTSRYDSGKDADIITYSMNKLPAAEREENSPGPTYRVPHLFVLTKSSNIGGNEVNYFNELKDQYNWYHQITKDIENNKEVLKAKALDITKNAGTDMAKIKAVFYWMQKNIHYLAFENGMAGFAPEKADEVLRKNYGDCKGMAHLTKQLLCALGFDARLCWIGTNHIAYDYTTPSLAVDNHMICALLYEGKTYFLDATESYIGFNEYAERIQNRQVLIEDGDKYILTRVPATSVTQNLDREKRVLAINGNDLQGTAEHLWKGEEKEGMLSNLNETKRDKAGEAFNKYLSNHNNDYEIKNLVTSDVSDFDRDLTASYGLNYKNGVSHFGKDYYVDMDFRKEFNGNNIDTAERRNDYWFYYKMNISRETELAIPAGYKVSSLPNGLSVKTNNYEFNIQYSTAGDKVLYKKTLMFKDPRIAKANFKQWNADIAKLTETYNQQLVLTAQ